MLGGFEPLPHAGHEKKEADTRRMYGIGVDYVLSSADEIVPLLTQMDQDQRSTGSITLLDSWFSNVEMAIVTTRSNAGNAGTNGTLIMENVQFNNVTWAVIGPDGVVLDNTNIEQETDKLFIMVSESNILCD